MKIKFLYLMIVFSTLIVIPSITRADQTQDTNLQLLQNLENIVPLDCPSLASDVAKINCKRIDNGKIVSVTFRQIQNAAETGLEMSADIQGDISKYQMLAFAHFEAAVGLAWLQGLDPDASWDGSMTQLENGWTTGYTSKVIDNDASEANIRVEKNGSLLIVKIEITG